MDLGGAGAFQAHAPPGPIGKYICTCSMSPLSRPFGTGNCSVHGVVPQNDKNHRCSQAGVMHQKKKEGLLGDAEFFTTSHLKKTMPPLTPSFKNPGSTTDYL